MKAVPARPWSRHLLVAKLASEAGPPGRSLVRALVSAQREAVASGDEMLVGAAEEVAAGAADHQCFAWRAMMRKVFGAGWALADAAAPLRRRQPLRWQ